MLVMADGYPSGCGLWIVVDESLDLAMDGVKMQYPLYGLTVFDGLTCSSAHDFSDCGVFLFAVYSLCF